MDEFPEGFILFCDMATTDDAVENARNYIRDHGLNADDVKIVRRDDCVLVKTKRDGVVLK